MEVVVRSLEAFLLQRRSKLFWHWRLLPDALTMSEYTLCSFHLHDLC